MRCAPACVTPRCASTVPHASAVDRVAAGGFDNLALLANGLISFDGDVNLAMGQSLSLTASAIGLAEQAAAAHAA